MVDTVLQRAVDALPKRPEEDLAVLAGKKYKPVALKVRPVYGTVPEELRSVTIYDTTAPCKLRGAVASLG